MAIKHAKAGEVVELAAFGPEGNDKHTVALVKTDTFETVRVFTSEGGSVPTHKVDGPITVQCLRGEAEFLVGEDARRMTAGDWLYLEGGQPHAIRGVTDCVLLVTILFAPA